MKPLGDERHHYWLALRMAKATGLDLAEEMAEGRITQADWAGVVTACRGCDWAGRCPDWLEAHPQVAAAPQQCVNAGRFAALKAEAP